ncbi:IclR family transcriptional regulator [Sciscionella marina]|uniref:IclR family transcriptional regulator n=1 Tax=Sciscionella marina TaxID=508770 RepID=UPI00035C5C57|nr:IclR family transcriptional regulator [Sciscionella marina]
MATEPTNSVHRAAAILLALGSERNAVREGLGVTEIARIVGKEKTQISRALRVLEETGLVERDRDSLGYRLGPRLFTMAATVSRQRLLVEAPAVLRKLVSATKEGAHLSVLDGTGALTVLSESPARALQAVSWVGHITPLHNTSSGRALLFDTAEQEVRELLADGAFPGSGPKSAPDADTVLARLAKARDRGYALVDEEFEEGLVATAAPVRDFRGRIVAALNVSAPKFRIGRELDTIGRMVRAAAEQLSVSLAGGQHRTPRTQRTGGES